MASDERGMDFSIQDHYGNYRGSRVNIRLYLVFPISPLPLIGFWTYLTLTESHSPGESKDRKSTRLNSSHANISYAVFCLKKKKINISCPEERDNMLLCRARSDTIR